MVVSVTVVYREELVSFPPLPALSSLLNVSVTNSKI